MNQPDFFDNRDGRVKVAYAHACQFSKDFLEWLPANLHILQAFCDEAIKLKLSGRTHYSSYTIVEFLRHHSAVTEKGGEWKINNNYRPYLPRLFDLLYPQHAGLFEYRVTTKPGEAA
jgi:hypothetical protein